MSSDNPEAAPGRIYHPILFTLLPIVGFVSANLQLMPLPEMGRPLVVVIVGSAAMGLLLRLLLRHAGRAALCHSATLLFFFLYRLLMLHWTVGLLSSILYVFVLWRIIRGTAEHGVAHRILNITSAIVISISALSPIYAVITGSVAAELDGYSAEQIADLWAHAPIGTSQEESIAPPDIFYILLDGYGREDVLRQMYDYDNGPFIEFLRDKGFTVDDAARSNYSQTLLSLGSTLNLGYLTEYLAHFDLSSHIDRRPLMWATKNNRVAAFLKDRGYTTVAMSSGYWGTEPHNPDVLYKTRFSLSESENALLGLTPIPDVLGLFGFHPFHEFHRNRIRYNLDAVSKSLEVASPKFVFAHFLCPHPPFVFDETGGPTKPFVGYVAFNDGDHKVAWEISAQQYRKAYKAQITYLNSQIIKVVNDIIEASPDAVIIIQGDHGPGSELIQASAEATNAKERLAILNAIRMPKVQTGLYNGMTPVNTFRAVFNAYFGTQMDYATDKSYLSEWYAPFNFFEVDISQ